MFIIVTVSPSPGTDQWIRDFSFSECADEAVAQDVLNLELARPSSRLGQQSRGTRASLSVSPRASHYHVKRYKVNNSYCTLSIVRATL